MIFLMKIESKLILEIIQIVKKFSIISDKIYKSNEIIKEIYLLSEIDISNNYLENTKKIT